MAERHITQKELGKLCGVSAACVGYILSGSKKYKFKPETIAKVRQMAAKYNYRPNYQATCLRKNKNNLLICIVGYACRYTDSLHIKYLTQEAEKAGFQLLVQYIVGLSDEKKLQFIRNIINIPAGIFIWSCGFENPDSLDRLTEILHNAPPMMHLNHPMGNTGMDHIRINWGGRCLPALLKHLSSRGVRRIGCCGGFFEKANPYLMRLPDIAPEYGMTGKFYVPSSEKKRDNYYHAAVEIAEQLLHEKELPEVIYCVSDEITLVLMDIFRRNGLKFPEGIQIISGGDSDLLNVMVDPPPILRQDIPKLAEIAVKHLTGRINAGENSIGENLCVAEINQRLLFPDGSTQLLAEDKIALKNNA